LKYKSARHQKPFPLTIFSKIMQLASAPRCLVIISVTAGANLIQSSSQEFGDFARILPKQEVPSTRL
jgi:hypothetical protein